MNYWGVGGFIDWLIGNNGLNRLILGFLPAQAVDIGCCSWAFIP